MRRPDVASIRPRGKPAETTSRRSSPGTRTTGFNSAACKPAETRQVNPFPAHITSLQFGRGCKPAETGRGRGVRHARGRASIRPRRQARGNLFPTPYGSLEANASIRPRLQARGNVEPVAIHSSPLELQFGCGGKPAETSRRMTSRSTRRVLQFGRLQARGNRSRSRPGKVSAGRFNSAAVASPRKRRPGGRGGDGVPGFGFGPAASPRKPGVCTCVLLAWLEASIRPRRQARGNP